MLALIPARGGSKSVILKNLHPLAGKPLIEYCIRAAQACPMITRVAVSTDHERIAQTAIDLGCEVVERPAELAGDDVPVWLAVANACDRLGYWGAMALLQPTSPFVQPITITQCLTSLGGRWASCQSVIPVPHNFHEWNQRKIGQDGSVSWAHPFRRRNAFNKNRKPKRYAFGNCIAFDARRAVGLHSAFPPPCTFVMLDDPAYALDVDQLADFRTAEFYIETGTVKLPHMEAA